MLDGGPVDAVEERVTRDRGRAVHAAKTTAVVHVHQSGNRKQFKINF